MTKSRLAARVGVLAVAIFERLAISRRSTQILEYRSKASHTSFQPRMRVCPDAQTLDSPSAMASILLVTPSEMKPTSVANRTRPTTLAKE